MGNLRVKESDRLAALQNELGKFGYRVNTGDDFIGGEGSMQDEDKDITVATYDDHRIAMAFAIGALKRGGVKIEDPDVVEKSFADFWNQLPKLGLGCRREGNVMIVETIKK